jgi:hypothetical protein
MKKMVMCAIAMAILLGKLYAQPISIIVEDFRYDSLVYFDASGLPTQKALYSYTKRGAPVTKGFYVYEDLKPRLTAKEVVISDEGDSFSTICYNLAEDSTWESFQTDYYLDEAGNGIKFQLIAPGGSVELDYDIHYGLNGRIDSIFSISLGFILEKYIYDYDLDGLLSRLKKEDISGTSVVKEYAYTKSEDGKLTIRITETYNYENDVLKEEQSVKEALYYDLKERPKRKEIYAWDLQINDFSADYYAYTIWYYSTPENTIPNYPKADANVNFRISHEQLIVDTPYSETIGVYSISGACFYTVKKMPGEITIPAISFPKGIYIVKGNCWVRKFYK